MDIKEYLEKMRKNVQLDEMKNHLQDFEDTSIRSNIPKFEESFAASVLEAYEARQCTLLEAIHQIGDHLECLPNIEAQYLGEALISIGVTEQLRQMDEPEKE